MPVMMRGPIVCQLWWVDLMYASYDEGTYCMTVMMSGSYDSYCGPASYDEGTYMYASYDEWTYCMAVMMRGPIVASYDERTYCMPVVMRGYIVYLLYYMTVMLSGPNVCQLRWLDLLYASYDEWTYCIPVMMRGPIVWQLWWVDLL